MNKSISNPNAELASIEVTCPYCNYQDWTGTVPLNGNRVHRCFACDLHFAILLVTVTEVTCAEIVGQV